MYKFRFAKLFILGAALALLLAVSPVPAQAETHIHFMVTPSEPAQGLEFYEALEAFKVKLAELAGGYTLLGQTQGGSFSTGSLVQSYNYTFLVAAPQDLTTDLELLVPQFFNDTAFILHWTGSMGISTAR